MQYEDIMNHCHNCPERVYIGKIITGTYKNGCNLPTDGGTELKFSPLAGESITE